MSGKRVGVLDYGASNILNVKRGLLHLGFEPISIVENNHLFIQDCDSLLLPGVGAFGAAINEIRAKKLDLFITDYLKEGKPLTGICLGMQLLLEESFEFGHHEGLGLISGSVKAIPTVNDKGEAVRVPHVGWSDIFSSDPLANGSCMYFVHSYRVELKNPNELIGHADYAGLKIPAIIQKDNITGFQFHPEKSGEKGLLLLKEYLSEKSSH